MVKRYLPLLIIVPLFGIYLGTLCPTVYLGDSGELTAAAFCLGIPHASGYPLYCLLGKLFCLIPLGTIAFRMNIMSTCFAVITVWLVYSLIVKMTGSRVGAFVGALSLAFTPVFWSQTVSAEVYTLHTFFVALLIRLLWWWDERREFSSLILLVFITGISFGNHIQTVMLAPAVLFIILSADKKALLNGKYFLLLSIFFLLALSLYLYLPVRTDAGAAIHWGDPNTLDRFLAHVTGRSHRASYVLNKTLSEYLLRAKETLWFVGSQFGLILLVALWGWLKLPSIRWRVFFVLVIVFDFVYTILLNIISLKITAFTLPTCIVLAILTGMGIAQVLRATERLSLSSGALKKIIAGACCVVPVFPLFLNLDLCNQAKNYTAYEHAVNILRTLENGDILFLDGDNNLFPVAYGRLAEQMREDVRLYDRQDIIFNIPYVGTSGGRYYGAWEDVRKILEREIIEKGSRHGIWYAVFDPFSTVVPSEYALVPYGVLHRLVAKKTLASPYRVSNLWQYYSSESFQDKTIRRDYLNRQVYAHFHVRHGTYLFMAGEPARGLRSMKHASQIAYDDTGIHAIIGIFLTNQGLFEEARIELEQMSLYPGNRATAHNNWGCYYFRIRDYKNAIASFNKAIELDPEKHVYYKNLAHALYKLGRKNEAALFFQKSLDIHQDQPEIRAFMRDNDLKYVPVK